jgi:NADH-quinone oxidoreductase subunit M
MPILLWLFLAPFIACLVVLILPFSGSLLKKMATVLSLIPLALLLYGHSTWLGSEVNYQWLPQLDVQLHLSVDSLSLLFLYLTAVIIPISLIAIQSQQFEQVRFFYALILLLEGLLIGFFAARDLVLFTLFYEAMLIPLYFIITLWGGAHRYEAALKFIVYMVAGSALMIAAVLGLYFFGPHSFNMDQLTHLPLSTSHLTWIGAVFLLAFAVKTPLFPFHGWLPDTYYQAPASGTILLSALLSKAGIYGFLRVLMEIFPSFIQTFGPYLLGFAIAGVLYGALAAWMQNDFKKLIAYSSFSHVNFILAGIFIWNETAHSGAILQAINHGITITALFLVASWLQQRIQSTRIGQYSGLAVFFPHLCWLTVFFTLSSIALPGTNNFIGEFLILFGLFGYSPELTALIGLSIIFSVVYMLRWLQKTYFEETSAAYQGRDPDIGAREFLIALPLIVLILWIGIYPAPFLKQTQAAAERIEFSPSQELKP